MLQQFESDVTLGRFISLILRHKPETIDITLEQKGWADVNALIQGICNHGYTFTKTDLDRIVRNNNKKRYEYDATEARIRATQGHSIPVDVDLQKVTPPDTLYHGTADRFVDNIYQLGISRQSRQHVHLSQDFETALVVGMRHGKPVVLKIDAKRMAMEGYTFYLSTNNVWLCDSVASEYII